MSEGCHCYFHCCTYPYLVALFLSSFAGCFGELTFFVERTYHTTQEFSTIHLPNDARILDQRLHLSSNDVNLTRHLRFCHINTSSTTCTKPPSPERTKPKSKNPTTQPPKPTTNPPPCAHNNFPNRNLNQDNNNNNPLHLRNPHRNPHPLRSGREDRGSVCCEGLVFA